MNRRTTIARLAAVALLPGRAWAMAPAPWQASLIGGAFDGASFVAGVRVVLDEGWKTYWRMPGDAGIPPQFDWTKSAGTAAIEVLYPLPGRFQDGSGETVGYQHEVIFPVRVKPLAGADAARLALDLFFAVCKEVCIPARAQLALALPQASRQSADDALVARWIGRVPVAGTPVASASAIGEDGRPVLRLGLSAAASDIFVEADGSSYFHAPVFSADGLVARIAVDGLKDVSALHGLALKLTVVTAGSALEQSLTVA